MPTNTWTGGSGPNVSTNANWSLGHAPLTTEDVVINSTATAISWDGGAVTTVHSLLLDTGFTGSVTLAASVSLTFTTTLTVNAGSLITASGSTSNLSVGTDLTIGVSGIIVVGNSSTSGSGLGQTITVGGNASITGNMNADGQGFASSLGPSSGTIPSVAFIGAGGGAHGGQGGCGMDLSYVTSPTGGLVTYDSITIPVNLGSGGAHTQVGTAGGAGGGAITLTVTGSLTVAGTLSAEGLQGGTAADACGGGGAGGSLQVSCNSLAGSGLISVSGGAGNSGGGGGGAGGGGGRASVVVTTSSTFGGTMRSFGGVAGTAGGVTVNYGAAGTVYLKVGAGNGTLTLDNNNNTPCSTLSTTSLNNTLGVSDLPTGSFVFDTLILKRVGVLRINTGASLNVSATSFTGSDSTGTLIHLAGTLTTGSSFTISNWTLKESTGFIVGLTDLVIGTGGILTHNMNGATALYTLHLTLNSLNVQAGGAINVNNLGFGSGQGPGAGGFTNVHFVATGGGGYGGAGGAGGSGGTAGGNTYGFAVSPIYLGSGAGTGLGPAYPLFGGSGGGAVILTVSGNVTVNGTISANGQAGVTSSSSTGGGSGGSIYIRAGVFSGSGVVTANGGDGSPGGNTGGGGGGRIAILTKSTFAGTMTVAGGAAGGSTGVAGSVGTIYIFTGDMSYDCSVSEKTVSTTYSAKLGDRTVFCDATSAGFTVTLPSTGIANCLMSFKKVDSSANAVVVSSSGLIDGASSVSLSTQYQFVNLMSDGVNWWLVGRAE